MRGWTLALALAVAGCGAGKSRLDLTVGATGTIAGVDHLRIFVTTAQGVKSKESDAPVNGSIPPSRTVPLRLPSSVRGKTTISVDAMAAGATTPLASVSGTVTITPSDVSTLTLTLPGGVVSPGDMMQMNVGPPTQLAFVAQPSDTAIGAAIKPAVTVAIEDANGAVVTTATTPITLALGTNPAQAVLGGTLTVTPMNGAATFADLTLDADGMGYTLIASAAMLTGATSSSFNVRAPVWTQATNGIFGGFIYFVVAAGKPTVMYAATRDSGVFVSSNGGGTWSGVPNGLPQVAVNGLAVDPSNTMHVFAATDDGVYVTSNGGAAWTQAFTTGPGTQFAAAAIDPAAPTHVFVSTFGKVYKSTDGGATFVDDSTGLSAGQIRSLAIGSTGVLATVYLSVANAPPGGVFRQPNAGGSWTKDSGWPTSGNFGSYSEKVTTLADGSVALCVTDSGNFITKSGAAGWTLITTGAPNNLQPPNGLSAAIDPSNAMKLYVGAAANPQANANGVWYSTDGGGTWNGFLNTLAMYSPLSIVVDPNDGTNVLAATPVGIFKTQMNGTSTPSNAGLTALPIYALAASGTVFAGTTSTGVFKSSDGGMNWGPSSGSGASAITGMFGSITALALDPTSVMTIYAGQMATGVWKSTDGGGTWTNVGTNASGVTDPNISAIAVAPENPMLIYAGTSAATTLFKSTNGGTSWASGNLTTMGTITNIVFDTTSANTVYVTGGTSVYKTTNGGVMWTPMNTNLPTTSAFTGLALGGGGALYVATTAGAIFKSSDGAMTWSPAGTVTVGALRMLAAHPTKTGLVYAATNAGVFRTTDGGTTWQAFNVGLSNINVLSVAFDRADPTIVYVGTGGGGVFKATP